MPAASTLITVIPDTGDARGVFCCLRGKKNLLVLTGWVALTGVWRGAETLGDAPEWGLITSQVPMTLIDVLDSAVKIGLGALIASVSTFLLSKAQHSRELEKLKINREYDVLKQVAEQVEVFTQIALRYWAYVLDLHKDISNGAIPSEEKRQDVKQARHELFLAFKELTSSEAKLLLLGLKPVRAAIRTYGDKTSEFYQRAIKEGEPLTKEEGQKWSAELRAARDSVYEALSGCYQRLGT